MPLTNKEEQIKKREKIKEDQTKYMENLEKDRKRKGASRALKKKSNKIWEEFKVKERIRVRQYRANRKETAGTSTTIYLPIIPYQSRQSFSKAKKGVLTTLPKSPRKRKAVIVALEKEEGLQMDILKNATSQLWAFQRRHRTHPPVL